MTRNCLMTLMQICWYLRKDSQFIKRSSAWQGCWIEGKSQCEVKEIKQIFKFKIINLWWYVLNYHYFIALFREVVESKVDDPRGKLTRLIKYTSGDARELIKHCIQLPSNEGFKHVRYLLEKINGNPHKILASYRKEVKNWQPIKFGDGIAFRWFHNFLLRCKSVATNQRWNALDNLDILCMLPSELPSGIMERWNREVLKIRRQQHQEPNLKDLTKYVEGEAILMSDPLFSQKALSESFKTRTFIERRSEKEQSSKLQGAIW